MVTRRPSPQTQAVLTALIGGPTYGYELMDVTGLSSGTLYPILNRLLNRGIVHSYWQPGPHGPQRRLYELVSERHTT